MRRSSYLMKYSFIILQQKDLRQQSKQSESYIYYLKKPHAHPADESECECVCVCVFHHVDVELYISIKREKSSRNNPEIRAGLGSHDHTNAEILLELLQKDERQDCMRNQTDPGWN